MLSSKYLKDRTCKIKQYLNYILTIINQNILAILRTFLNLKKKKKKNPTPSELPQLRLLNLFRKLLTEKKKSNEHFNICEAEISLDEMIKYINSEIINLQLMMILRQNFVNTFQIN